MNHAVKKLPAGGQRTEQMKRRRCSTTEETFTGSSRSQSRVAFVEALLRCLFKITQWTFQTVSSCAGWPGRYQTLALSASRSRSTLKHFIIQTLYLLFLYFHFYCVFTHTKKKTKQRLSGLEQSPQGRGTCQTVHLLACVLVAKQVIWITAFRKKKWITSN